MSRNATLFFRRAFCVSVLALLASFNVLAPIVTARPDRSDADTTASDSKPADPSVVKVRKNRLLFPDGKVLVSLPKFLRVFKPEEYEKHFGAGTRPEFAFVDDSTESRFTVSILQSKLGPTELETYRIKMEKTFARSMKELIWYKREMIKLGETDWAHLELQNQTTDGATVMSDFYVTSMGGHPLVFTIMTDTKYWYEMRKVMQKMMLSVMVEEKPAASTSDAPTSETSAK